MAASRHGLAGRPSNNRRSAEASTSRIVTQMTAREKARAIKTAEVAGDRDLATLVRRLLAAEAERAGVPE